MPSLLSSLKTLSSSLLVIGLMNSAVSQAQGMPPAKVSISKATLEQVTDTTTIPGIVDFNTTSHLTSEQTGIIAAIYVDEGDIVKAGDTIAQLNTDLLKQDVKIQQAELQALQAEQGRIEKDIERSEKLLKTSFESKRALENLKFSLAANKANRQRLAFQIERLNILIKKSTIKANFDGLILEEHKQPGEWLGQADPIVTIAKTSDTVARVSIPERYVRFIEQGEQTPIEITPLGINTEGKVLSTVPVADLRTKSVPLKVQLDYQQGLIRNMSLKVVIPTSEKHAAITFPRDALIQHQGKEFVYVATPADEGMKATIIPAQITGRYGNRVAVAPGMIQQGMSIITKGNDRLRPDQPILIDQ
jgi:RND family efflux transporter MFP subunit